VSKRVPDPQSYGEPRRLPRIETIRVVESGTTAAGHRSATQASLRGEGVGRRRPSAVVTSSPLERSGDVTAVLERPQPRVA